jgi:hypothetical protein
MKAERAKTVHACLILERMSINTNYRGDIREVRTSVCDLEKRTHSPCANVTLAFDFDFGLDHPVHGGYA